MSAFQNVDLPEPGTGGRMFFDGKRMRKAVVRKTVDFNSSMVSTMDFLSHNTPGGFRDQKPILNDPSYILNYLVPRAYMWNPAFLLTTKFMHISTNKVRCPVNIVKWTPEGRRLITGSSSGEFTLWNGLTFNFETILQAHEQAIRAMIWSHSGNFLVSGDHVGSIKYWQPNLNNVQGFQGHKQPIRDLSFSPTDNKFASCSDDATIKIWDFIESREESELKGHGWDVKNVQWHPTKSLLASGSKDNTVRLWDPRTSRQLAIVHGHKNTVLDLKWNMNGNWLLTCGKDQLIKIYDIRKLEEMYIFKGHKKEITSLAWHPSLENMFVSGGFEGSMYFWYVGLASNEASPSGSSAQINVPLSFTETAHEAAIWSLDWHPVGHVLVSGSNDHSTRFWTRSRPTDPIDEKDYRIAGAGLPGLAANAIGHDNGGDKNHHHHHHHHHSNPNYRPLQVPSHFQKRKRETDQQ